MDSIPAEVDFEQKQLYCAFLRQGKAGQPLGGEGQKSISLQVGRVFWDMGARVLPASYLLHSQLWCHGFCTLEGQ